MRGLTHLTAGLALAAITNDVDLAMASGIVLGSVLPDIDSSKSIIGRYIPVIPRLLPHRTITHSIWPVLLFAVLCPPLAVGCILHDVLDMCNPDGVPLLWPVKREWRAPIISSIIRY